MALVLGRRVNAQNIHITGIQSSTVSWSEELQAYVGLVALTVSNTGPTAISFFGATSDCGAFTTCTAWANSQNIPAGGTNTLMVRASLPEAYTVGDITVYVYPFTGSDFDRIKVHAVVSGPWGDSWTTTLVSFPPNTYTPQLSPHGTIAQTVAANTTAGIPMGLVNAGNASATYSLAVSCTGVVVSCAIGFSSFTLAPGQGWTPNIARTTGAGGGTGTVRLVATAPPRASGLVEADTVTFNITTADLIAPTIGFGAFGTTHNDPNFGPNQWVTTPTAPLVVDVCDQDGTVGTPTLTVDGTAITATSIVNQTRAGCTTAKEATYTVPLHDGFGTIAASVSDGIHPSTSVIYYSHDAAPELKPQIIPSPNHASAWNKPVVDTFVVRNPGTLPATYSISLNPCIIPYGECHIPDADTLVTLAGGASLPVPVSFAFGGPVGTSVSVPLWAVYKGVFDTVTTFASNTVTAVGADAPTITMPNGTTIVTSTKSGFGTVEIDWCDDDDAIVSHTVAWQGGSTLPDVFTSTTRPGCVSAGTSIYNNIVLQPYQQTLVVTAVDALGHSTVLNASFTYNAPLSAFAPDVTWPGLKPTIVRRFASSSTAAADTFVVKNIGTETAGYALGPVCHRALSACTTSPAAVSLPPNSQQTVVVNYTRSGTLDVVDTVGLIATYTAPVGGAIADTAFGRLVAAPSRETAPVVTRYPTVIGADAGSTFPAIITITNTSSVQESFIISATATAGFQIHYGDTISINPTTIGPNQQVQTFFNVHGTAANLHGTITYTVQYTTVSGTVLSGTATDSIATSSTAALQAILHVRPQATSPLQVPASATSAYKFFIANSGTGGTTAQYAVDCSASAAIVPNSCALDHASKSMILGDSDIVTVTYATAASAGQTGQIKLVANGVGAISAIPDSAVGVVTTVNGARAIIAFNQQSTTATKAPGTTFTQQFTVNNAGTLAGTFNYSAVCDAPALVGSCTVDHTSKLVNPSASDIVAVTYTTAATAGLTSALHLTVTSPQADLPGTATMTVTTGVVSAIVVNVRGLNPGSAIARDQCLTIAAGSAAAYECGELRLVHPLPTTAVMSKARTPTLIYISENANPRALVAADVTVGSSITPDRVVGTLKLRKNTAAGDLVPVSTTWNVDASWQPNQAHRVAINFDALANSIPTGAYLYTFEVAAFQGATSVGTSSMQDTLVIVDRHRSTIGRGWWIDGLEQIAIGPNVTPDSSQRLWIGGDGSTRLYNKVASSPTRWAVSGLEGPDTVLAISGGGYRRLLRDSAFVEFNPTGQHIKTQNKQKHVTTFSYVDAQTIDVGGRLNRITLPTAIGPAPYYKFNYSSTGTHPLTSVTSPANRTTTVVPITSSLNIQAITDPDQHSVTFNWNATTNVLTSRVDRRGHSTTYGLDGAGKLQTSSIDMSSNGLPAIVTTYCAAESRGIATCPVSVATPGIYSVLDGPRTDVTDITKFFINRFGAPDTIENALGKRTTITRDANFRMLAAGLTQPNGYLVTTVYNPRGLPISSTTHNPLNTGLDATTTYQWNAVWDEVTSIRSAMGVLDSISYFANGDREWQQRGTDPGRRIFFGYVPTTRMLSSVVSPSPLGSGTVTTSYGYDTLGNVVTTTLPNGLTTTVVHSAAGLDSTSYVPVSRQLAPGVLRSTYALLDAMGRDTATYELGGMSMSDPALQMRLTRKQYDAEGNLTLVSLTQTPDATPSISAQGTAQTGLGAIQTAYQFDAANRKTQVTDPIRGTTKAHWRYDPAGNVVVASRGVDSTVVVYDALNRVTNRNVLGESSISAPGTSDAQDFAYDDNGNVLRANSRASRVTRDYYRNGSLRSETQDIYSTTRAGALHDNVLLYTYDFDGRRTSMQPLTTMGGLGTITYKYDTQTGTLDTLTNVASNGRFVYFYQNSGMLDHLVEADGTVEQYFYDQNGRKTSRVERRARGDVIHADTTAYDDVDEAVLVTGGGVTNNSGFEVHTYGPIGGIQSGMNNHGALEQTPRDPLGNLLMRVPAGAELATTFQYLPNTNVLFRTGHTIDENAAETDSTEYRTLLQTGDLVGTFESIRSLSNCQQPDGTRGTQCGTNGTDRRTIATSTTTRSYNSDGRITWLHKDTSNDHYANTDHAGNLIDPNGFEYWPSFGRGVEEEYRYDALGRRVWMRSDHNSGGCTTQHDRDSTTACQSSVQRFVYDGDNVILEIRQPGGSGADSTTGHDSVTAAEMESDTTNTVHMFPLAGYFGTVAYMHGPGIDHPLMMVRNDAGILMPVVLHYQWQGVLEVATWLNGDYVPCQAPPPHTNGCEFIEWPGSNVHFGLEYSLNSLDGPPSWWGTLAELRPDATGTLDMRNRSYDPKTQRFTQEDPLGLAGGLNVYGFAGGDPVNYSDPFGLCPTCESFDPQVIDRRDRDFRQNIREAGPAGVAGAAGMGLVAAAGGAAVMGASAGAIAAANPLANAILPVVAGAVPKLMGLAEKFETSASDIVNKAATIGTRMLDTKSGNVNAIIPRLDGASGWIRVTLDPTMSRVVSAGYQTAAMLKNGLANGRFIPK